MATSIYEGDWNKQSLAERLDPQIKLTGPIIEGGEGSEQSVLEDLEQRAASAMSGRSTAVLQTILRAATSACLLSRPNRWETMMGSKAWHTFSLLGSLRVPASQR